MLIGQSVHSGEPDRAICPNAILESSEPLKPVVAEKGTARRKLYHTPKTNDSPLAD